MFTVTFHIVVQSLIEKIEKALIRIYNFAGFENNWNKILTLDKDLFSWQLIEYEN